MAKRKLNKQQRARLLLSQTESLQLDATLPHEEGLVICCFGTRALVEKTDGSRLECMIRQHIQTLTAGDKIVFRTETDTTGVIISLFPRKSVLERLDKYHQLKPTAANVTQLVIVIAPSPAPSWPLLDTYLIAAEQAHLEACIVVNKTDLAMDDIQSILTTHYAPLQYPILFTSKNTPESYDGLTQQLAKHTSVFIGQSGVGKSSLISTLLPHELNIQIGEISHAKDVGKHTTSTSRFYHLPNGGALIDSPGVRSFQPANLTPGIILKGYREFHPFIGHCQFRNCNHRTAPGCALLKGLADKHISVLRYENFVKLVDALSISSHF